MTTPLSQQAVLLKRGVSPSIARDTASYKTAKIIINRYNISIGRNTQRAQRAAGGSNNQKVHYNASRPTS